MYRLKKLNARGASHIVALMGVIVLSGIIGSYLLVASHAATGPAASAATTPTAPPPVTTDPMKYPLVWVHGFVETTGACAGIKADNQVATLTTLLKGLGYRGTLLSALYYCHDTATSGAFDIRSASHTYAGQYDNSVSIEQLGLDLAWAIYNNYSSQGQYVYLMGHSMGGLIIDEALTKAGTAGYPPSLLVKSVVTYSTPYAGQDVIPNKTAACAAEVQCSALQVGSTFLQALQQRTLPKDVDYTTIGGSPKDTVDSFASSSAVTAQHKVNYNSILPVGYSHTTYYTDVSKAQDEPYQITNKGVTTPVTGSHATLLGAQALFSNSL